MKNFRFTSRRKFILVASMSSVLGVLGSLSRKALAQPSPVSVPKPNISVPGSVTPKTFRLPQNTQLLLRDIKRANPSDPASLSRSREVSPEELESSFDKLNDAFSFNPSSGKLTRNSAVRLDSDEERIVQQILVGYQRQVQAGEIKLRRGANQRLIPLPAEPEIERQGVVTQIPQNQVKSTEKLSKYQKLSDLSPLSWFAPSLSSSGTDAYLVAQGCSWVWWRKTYWWGIRISLNRTAVDWIASGAGTVAAILAAMGITGIGAVAIGAAAGILKAFSNDNGVRIYVTWTGVSWLLPKPTPSRGC